MLSSNVRPLFGCLLMVVASITEAATPQARAALENDPTLEYAPDSVLVLSLIHI